MSKLSNEIIGNRSDHWTATSPFPHTFKHIREAVALIDVIEARIEDTRHLSSQARLQRIAQWASFEMNTSRPRVRDALHSQGRALINSDGRRWTFNVDTKLPALNHLDELRRLMGS